MTKEEFKTKYYSLNVIRERAEEAMDVEELNQLSKTYLMQIDDLVDAYKQLYPYFKEAVYIRGQFHALLNSPDYLDYLHDNHELFTNLLEYARQIEELNIVEVPRYGKLAPAIIVARCIRKAIGELFNLKKKNGKPFFEYGYQWRALYEVIVVENTLLPIKDQAEFRDIAKDSNHPLHFLPTPDPNWCNDDKDKRNFKGDKKNDYSYKEIMNENNRGKDETINIEETKKAFLELLNKHGIKNRPNIL